MTIKPLRDPPELAAMIAHAIEVARNMDDEERDAMHARQIASAKQTARSYGFDEGTRPA